MTQPGYVTGWRWPDERGERIVEDETRPLQQVPAKAEPDPMGLGEINWPKVVLILGVTLILAITIVTVVALMILPSQFWMAS